jgi:DNA modification methylase
MPVVPFGGLAMARYDLHEQSLPENLGSLETGASEAGEMLALPEWSVTTLDTVHHCDALTLLRALPSGSVDCVVTDPPYGLGGRVFDFPHKKYSAVNESWDLSVPLDWMETIQSKLKPGGSVLCFGGRQSIYQIAAQALTLGWRIVNDITWYKPDAPPCFTGRMMTESTERILWFCPSGKNWIYNLDTAKNMNHNINLRDVWAFNVTKDSRYHPTQKPLKLMERIVDLFTNPGDIILDPFIGSGTTAVAARNLGRHFIGCDISREYVDMARKRLAQPFTLPMFETVAAK